MLTIELLNACASFAAFDQQGHCALRAPGLVALARMRAKATKPGARSAQWPC